MPLSSPNQKYIIVKQVCLMRTISKALSGVQPCTEGIAAIHREYYRGYCPQLSSWPKNLVLEYLT